MVIFTKHAEDKFEILARHKFFISREQVLETLAFPDGIDLSRSPLLIAQKGIDDKHALRVVYKKENNFIKVITFYPARIKQYKI